MPSNSNFLNKILWFTVSKVFARSMKHAIVISLLLIPLKISFENLAIVFMVEQSSQNLLGCIATISFFLSETLPYHGQILSIILEGRGNNETGLRFDTLDLSPPFCNGIIFAIFHSSGDII